MMMRLIIETAIHWMQIGLPLKLLKIVVFARDLKKISKDPLLEYFANLKGKCIAKMEKEEKAEVVCEIIFCHSVFFAYQTVTLNQSCY